MSEKSAFVVGEDGELIYRPGIKQIDPRKILSQYDNWFEVTCEAKGCQPDKIEIKVTKDVIKVSGNQETRAFYTEFILEDGVAPDSLICSLWHSAGVLIISAPKKGGLAKSPVFKSEVPANVIDSSSTRALNAQKANFLKELSAVVSTPKPTAPSPASTKPPADWMKITPADSQEKLEKSGQGSRHELIIPSVVDEEEDDTPGIANDPRFEDVTKYLCLVADDKGIETFELNFEMPEYSPEEIIVQITKRVVTIMAKHESITGRKTTRCKMFKKFTIPEGAAQEDVICILKNEVLTVSVTRAKEVHQRKQLGTKINVAGIEDVLKKRGDKVCNSAGQIVDKNTLSSTDTMATCTSTGPTAASQTATSTFPKSSSVIKTKIVSAESLKNYKFENAEASLVVAPGSTTFVRNIQVAKEFSAEDIEVKMCYNLREFNWVIIEGKQELRSFTQMFTVPPGVKLENVSVSLSDTNKLTVTAPIERK